MLLTANAESGTDGTSLTAGTDFDIVNNGTSGSNVYTASGAINGTLSYKTITGSASTYVGWSTSLGGTPTELWTRMYASVPAYYAGSLCQFRLSGNSAGRISLTNAGKISVKNGADVSLGTSSTILGLNTPFRLEVHAIAGAGNTGTLEVRIFAGKDDSTPTETIGPLTAAQTAAAFDQVWFGPFGTGQSGNILYHDDDAVTDTGWLGPTGAATSAPANITNPPKPSGTAIEGYILTATSPGTWSGSPSPTFAYQWRRCDSSGNNAVNISGATGTTYTVTSADVGSTIRVAVTATNTSGSATSASPQSNVVTAAPSTRASLSNTADGTNGTAVTSGSSGNLLGDPLDVETFNGAGTAAFDTTTFAHGSASIKVTSGGVNAYVGWGPSTLGTQSDLYARVYVKMSAYPAAGAGIIRFYSGANECGAVNITSTGTVRLRDASNTTIATGTSIVPLNTWVRIEAHITPSTTAGAITSRYYASKDSSTITETLTATNAMLTAALDTVDFGIIGGSSGDVIWIDELATDTSWIGPYVSSAPRWGWGMVTAPGIVNTTQQGGGSSQTAADVIWGMNLFNGGNPYYGTSESASTCADRETATFGKIGMSKTYSNSLSTFNVGYEGQNPSQRSVVCMKYDQVGLANGTYDSDLRGYVRSIPAGWYVILVNWQEPDNDMFPDQGGSSFTWQQHRDASNHVADVVHDEIANNRLHAGTICEVWDNFQFTTIRRAIGGTPSYGTGTGWFDDYAALRTDGIAWDLYINPPPAGRQDKNGGSSTPLVNGLYGVGDIAKNNSVLWVGMIKTIVDRLKTTSGSNISKWGLFEIGAPFREDDQFATSGKPDGYYRAQWFQTFFDAIIAADIDVALVFNAIGTGFDQRLIQGDASNFVAPYQLLPNVSWNPASRPNPNEEPAVTVLRSYFSQGL